MIKTELKRSDFVKRTSKINAMNGRDQYLKVIADEANSNGKDSRINVNYLMTLGYYKSDIEEAVDKGYLKVVAKK